MSASTGSYDARQEAGGFASELARLKIQVELSWQQEARLMGWLGLHDGQHVLEVGAGPGFVTEQLLALLPTSALTVVEPDAALNAYAVEYLAARGGERVTRLEASILDPALPAGTFDVAIARFVIQHLPDPLAALTAIRRLLKPGGRLIVTDIDGELWGLVQPVQHDLGPIFARAARAQVARGGDRTIGRKLHRLLAAAGFSAPQLDAFVYHSDELGLDAFHPQLDPERQRPAVDQGFITEAEMERVAAGYARFRAAPEALVMFVGLMASGVVG